MTPAEIKSARLSLGLSRTDFARIMRYGDPNRISEFESGGRRPSAQAQQLIRAYIDGYRPADWIKGD